MVEEIERAILSKLVLGDHPVLTILRAQAEVVTVLERDYSEVGRNVYLEVPASAPRATPRSFDLMDVAFHFEDAENDGHAVLMVRDGVMSELMLYNWTDDWPDHPVLAWVKYLVPNRAGVSAHPAEHRDLEGLAAELAAA